MSRRQLLAAGVSDRVIERLVLRKRLRRIHSGVYEIGGRQRNQTTLFGAAVLACGDGAVLSHRSAAAHWGLRPQHTGLVDVSMPRGGSRRRVGIRIHVPRSLPPSDLTIHDRIPCTRVPRTLIDLAGVLPATDLRRALERSLILRIYDQRAIDDALARANGRRGIGKLRVLVAELADDPPPTRSELERRFLDLIDAANLPRPITNGLVCGYEVDFHWPDKKRVVETDGATTHATVTAFHRDHQRDLDLELAGWHVLRITWRQLQHVPERVLALLRRHL